MLGWIIHYEIAAIIILIALTFLFFTGNRIKTKESRMFLWLLVLSIAMAVFDEAAVFCNYYHELVPICVSYFVNIVYLSSTVSVIWVYVLYVILLTRSDYYYSHAYVSFLSIPIILEFLLIFSAPFNHVMFYIDENGASIRESGMTQIFIVCACYGSVIAYLGFTKKRMLTRLQRMAVCFYTLAGLVGTIVQMLWPEYLLNAFIFALGLLMLYIAMQGNYVDVDRMLNTFSGEALSKKINMAIEQKKDFYILMVRLGGLEEINLVHGFDVTNEILRQVSDYLVRVIPGHQVYHVTGTNFAMYLEMDENSANGYARKIMDKLSDNIYVRNVISAINIPYKMAMIKVPEMANNSVVALSLLNIMLPDPKISDSEKFVTVKEEDIKAHTRRLAVENAIEKAVRSGSFELHLQPIISIENGTFSAAEALIRLKDDVCGEIAPSEFIPIAESNGSIVQITDFVVNRVCRLLSLGTYKKKGIDSIAINVSPVECLQAGMAERIISIIQSYNVDPSAIVIDISERSFIGNNCNLTRNIKALSDYGVRIALDDYGADYSNLPELLSLPVEIIKIDRSMLLLASDSDEAELVLVKVIDALKGMNRKVLVEGVEDEEQVDLLWSLQCDFLQGYYYSKAVDEEMFLEVVDNKNLYGL